MKKLKVLVVALGLLLVGNVASAQKIGYIDAETILYLMPETAKIDSIVRLYQIDTVAKEYSNLLQTYQYKDSILKDSAHPIPAAVRTQITKELTELVPTLQNWQQIAQEATQNKQNQLLAPVMARINKAINDVAKEKGYTYVVTRDAVLVAPEADNMLASVAKKLNITLPPQLQPGYKPPTGAGAVRP